MDGNKGEQCGGASGVGRGAGDGGASDDRADRYRGGEIDEGPLGQRVRSPRCSPTTAVTYMMSTALPVTVPRSSQRSTVQDMRAPFRLWLFLGSGFPFPWRPH